MNGNSANKFDYAIVGGGLQAALIVKALRYYQPDSTVLLLERSETLCGNHTWSFHASDIPQESQEWVGTLPFTSWDGYSVEFPGHTRRVGLKYCSLDSADVRQSILSMANSRDSRGEQGSDVDRLKILTSTVATKIDSKSVETENGQSYQAKLVIDCCGRPGNQINPVLKCGFQKFHGFEVELGKAWPDKNPVLMDARVPQVDGFRFLYVLPMSDRRVLIEDTRFSDFPHLERSDCLNSLQSYLNERAFNRFEIVREEHGCLPMPYSSGMKPQLAEPLRGGYAGGWFHAATGYSFPLAVRFADAVASSPPHEAAQRIFRLARQNQFQAGFSRFLNRLLFRAVKPEQRWQIFRRFYRALPDAAIERFYGHRFTRMDAARMIISAPPPGLTPVRFFNSFEASPCLATQS